MFTGIIESTGKIVSIENNGFNKTFQVESNISSQLKTDESISHNGVCLTVEKAEANIHKVTAIQETLTKTNLDSWKIGDLINLERSMLMNGRLDGHIVQGHIDSTAVCVNKKEMNGSWEFIFSYDKKFALLIIEKGSICINGVSLTAFNVKKRKFTAAIIPYTFHHTNFSTLEKGSIVNIEFDVIGKYVNRIINKKSL